MGISFKELRKAIRKEPETILALGKDEDGGIRVVKNYGEGTQHSVALTMAKMHKSDNPKLIFIKGI